MDTLVVELCYSRSVVVVVLLFGSDSLYTDLDYYTDRIVDSHSQIHSKEPYIDFWGKDLCHGSGNNNNLSDTLKEDTLHL